MSRTIGLSHSLVLSPNIWSDVYTLYKYTFKFLCRNTILTANQSTRGDSDIIQHVNITNDFGKALDEGKEERVLFCDISKAFDRVWHKGLLYKLKAYGISRTLLEWFRNYSMGRVQWVF